MSPRPFRWGEQRPVARLPHTWRRPTTTTPRRELHIWTRRRTGRLRRVEKEKSWQPEALLGEYGSRYPQLDLVFLALCQQRWYRTASTHDLMIVIVKVIVRKLFIFSLFRRGDVEAGSSSSPNKIGAGISAPAALSWGEGRGKTNFLSLFLHEGRDVALRHPSSFYNFFFLSVQWALRNCLPAVSFFLGVCLFLFRLEVIAAPAIPGARREHASASRAPERTSVPHPSRKNLFPNDSFFEEDVTLPCFFMPF